MYKLIMNEHPQTIALVLTQLEPEIAAKLMEQLPADLKADVALRVANLRTVSPAMIAAVAAVVEKINAQIPRNSTINASKPATNKATDKHFEKDSRKIINGRAYLSHLKNT